MIVRSLDTLDPDRTVDGGTWVSRRLLLARDGTRFSLHDTVLRAGTTTTMWYRHHVEAVYCVGGTGWLHDDEAGTRHALREGVLYCLDGHEHHRVEATTDLRMICVFDPPLSGGEVHDADGAYPPSPGR